MQFNHYTIPSLMKIILNTMILCLLCTLSFAQGIASEGTLIVGEHNFNDSLKEKIVKLVKSQPKLASYYSQAMDEAFNFLDNQDPRRINARDIKNLATYSLSVWTPSHSFRYGQGDYSLCQGPNEVASFDFGTIMVGFDTSYKREETYGFWAVLNYEYNWCEIEGSTTKGRISLRFTKWLSEREVAGILE